jgi:hypothetical protein
MNLILASPPGRSRRAPVQGEIIFRRDARAHDHRGHASVGAKQDDAPS